MRINTCLNAISGCFVGLDWHKENKKLKISSFGAGTSGLVDDDKSIEKVSFHFSSDFNRSLKFVEEKSD